MRAFLSVFMLLGAQLAWAQANHEQSLLQAIDYIRHNELDKALGLLDQLTNEQPNFYLAHLIKADVLLAKAQGINRFGSISESLPQVNPNQSIIQLKSELQQRIKAQKNAPAPGLKPSQLIQLSSQNKFAIAIDTSQSRLFLLENKASGIQVKSTHYVSVGKLGTDKRFEGDQKTPLGIYFITSALQTKQLKEDYGAGALTLNYPNPVDERQGRAGGGIWIHGTPPHQYSRPPLASDGCIVLSNPELLALMNLVNIQSTPVIIANNIKWVTEQSTQNIKQNFMNALKAWQNAKINGDEEKEKTFYSLENHPIKPAPLATIHRETKSSRPGKPSTGFELKDISIQHWQDGQVNAMIVSMGVVPQGSIIGRTIRQYWLEIKGRWVIIFEGSIS